MSTEQLFIVTIVDPKATGGKPVTIKTPLTAARVAHHRAHYAQVTARPVDVKAPRTGPGTFHNALLALIECYKAAEARGDVGLAKRAQDATAALVGEQPDLKGDDERPAVMRPRLDSPPRNRRVGMGTLPGLGGSR